MKVFTKHIATVTMLLSLSWSGLVSAQVDQATLDSLRTPDTVQTSIGSLSFFDGVPSQDTVLKAYDNLDRMRGVDAFLKGIPGASTYAFIQGVYSIGAVEAHQVVITDQMLDSQTLLLTGNTSTLYALPTLDLERDGPTVLEVPAGMLGLIDDAWMRHLGDIGPLGPDAGEGGKFLILPPGYQGGVPDDYFVVRSDSYHVWVVLRASIAEGLEAASETLKDNLRIYPLAKKDNPPQMEFISSADKAFNTIYANDFTFFEEINEVIQKEPFDLLDPEIRGLFASVGIEKGKPFQPDARMKEILSDAAAIGNATARALVWSPRTDGTMEGIEIYPEADSAWQLAWVNKNVFFNGPNGKTLNSDARSYFHYIAIAISPAMAVELPGKGSDYALAFVDADKQPLDGAKTYKLHIPANVPAKDFWAVTVYDTQTRSMLQTDQPFPTVGSQTGLKQNPDGSYDIYFGPKPVEGFENNWLQTKPGKSWFTLLRLYGPLEAWLNRTWRPSEIEPVNDRES